MRTLFVACALVFLPGPHGLNAGTQKTQAELATMLEGAVSKWELCPLEKKEKKTYNAKGEVVDVEIGNEEGTIGRTLSVSLLLRQGRFKLKQEVNAPLANGDEAYVISFAPLA